MSHESDEFCDRSSRPYFGAESTVEQVLFMAESLRVGSGLNPIVVPYRLSSWLSRSETRTRIITIKCSTRNIAFPQGSN